MDYADCNVVYVDRAACQEKTVRRDDATSVEKLCSPSNLAERATETLKPSSPVVMNIRTLLGTFIHIFKSGKSCITKLSELNQTSIVDLIPTLVLIDIPYDDQLYERPARDARTPSPGTKQPIDGLVEEHGDDEAYGLKLLQWIASEIQYQSLSKLIVPVALVTIPDQSTLAVPARGRSSSRDRQAHNPFIVVRKPFGLATALDQARTMRFLDLGAVDVLTSPLLLERLPSLAIHAYRAHKDASKEQRALLEMKRGRKRSWVGVDDQKPYAYLREAMVSGLMDGICRLGGEEEPPGHMRISVSVERRAKVAAAVGEWHFSAHDFTDDELLHAALLMLQHALAMPELERWRISTENLTGFLVASRSAYNAFVPYHNFRHVVDVLQAIFYFLVRLGRLRPYPVSSSFDPPAPSPIAALIRPFDALTLLITAIGHDVGHPGVNNAFLVTLNAPLAQLYNDRSVLESFHCAAYSQILRRHWPAAFQGVEMRQLMINSILATDMGLHFDYMKKLGWLQEKLHENGGTDGWNGRLLEEQRTLACSLLIKCADISNVARTYEVAAKWTMILTDEFARQASMEQDLGIPSALFAAPVREIIELGKSQIGFMNMFAIPLFQGVTDVMPAMGFCVDELHANKKAWEDKIAAEQTRLKQDAEDFGLMDGMFSPRAMSVATPSDASHQKIGSATSLAKPSSDVDPRIVALLNKSPFEPANSPIREGTEHSSMPELETGALVAVDSTNPSPGEPNQDSSRRSSKPSQLQLSFATASAPGLLDHPSLDPAAHELSNGHAHRAEIQDSLVTEPVLLPPNDTTKSHAVDKHEKQRSSDTTEGSSSAAGDWASQATSATTGKMPLSPSTKGTSIMSDDPEEQNGIRKTPTNHSLVGSGSRGSQTSTVNPGERALGQEADAAVVGAGEGKGYVMEKVRSLRKRPSRFRMHSLNFWKRSKSASPAVPVPVPVAAGEARRMASEDETTGDGAVLR